jgi:hypothetical protein
VDDVSPWFPAEALAKLAAESMREVHVAAGEDVFASPRGGRVREDELAILITGAVAVGDGRAWPPGAYTGPPVSST